MSELSVKIRSLTSNGLFAAVLIGILIRLLLIPFSLEYDTNFWTIVIRNIESGNGLYLMEGYYYTPVWGYILGFVAGMQNALLDIGDLSVVCYDLVSYIMVDHYAYTDMAVSIVFMLILKTILWICDFILSLTVYHLVKERTEDEKKAVIAFIMVFVCPHVIGSSSIVVMPDTISAMFTMITILLLKNDKYLFAGICYSIAVWVKFFPIAIILVLLCYIYVGTQGNGREAAKRIAKAIIGFMGMSLIIFLPQMMEGTMVRCLAFFIDRIREIINNGIFAILCGVILGTLIIIAAIYIAKHMLKVKGNMDDRMMEYSLLLLGICMLSFTNLQYIVTMIPFLVYCLMTVDRNYKYIWIVLAIAGFILTFMLNTNAVMLNSIVAYTSIVSSDTATWLFDILNEEIVFGLSIVDLFCSFANNIQKIVLFCVVPIFIIRRAIGNKDIFRWHS